ncbi:hypothetical protein niasHS_005870 [Heterodera schachtii]|uniref:Transthyretin-like family protein n=2 Tax=Heterodera TaxID=34509 RepID=A0ABD2JRV7_HETSC
MFLFEIIGIELVINLGISNLLVQFNQNISVATENCECFPIWQLLSFSFLLQRIAKLFGLYFIWEERNPSDAPATGILVKLYDDDGLFGFDDLLAKGYTDQNGHFAIYGSTNEISKIEPKVNIYHDCNDILPCQRKISISVPDGVVYEGHRPSGLFSVGVLELGSEYGGESRDCFHR